MALDTETFAQLRATVERFVDERLIPREAEVDELDLVPDDVIEEMKALGLFGLSIPQAYGGLGLDMVEETELALVLGRTSPAFRSVFGTNVGIGSQGIVIDGTEEQRQRYLPGMAAGEIIGSFCLTEPGHGSDAGGLETRAAGRCSPACSGSSSRWRAGIRSADRLHSGDTARSCSTRPTPSAARSKAATTTASRSRTARACSARCATPSTRPRIRVGSRARRISPTCRS